MKSWASGIVSKVPRFSITQSAPQKPDLSTYLRERHPGLASVRITVDQSAFLEGKPIAWLKTKQAIIEAIPKA